MMIIMCFDILNIGSTCIFIISIQTVRINLHISIELTSCLFSMLMPLPLQTLSIQSTGYNNNLNRCAKRAFEKLFRLTKSLVTNQT